MPQEAGRFSNNAADATALKRTRKNVGPSLKGLFQRTKLRNGNAVTEKNIRSRIEQGGDGMPAFSDLLSDKEKIDLISYLKTL